MAAGTCCAESKEEQLYMLELLVDRLNLTPDKIRQIGSTPLSVRLDFLDFPSFEINEEEFWSAQKRKDKQTSLQAERKSRDGSLDFSAGKSCLFPKKPGELVKAMRSKPLRVSVYKITKKEPCKSDLKDDPVCKSEVPLTGCLCDQVAMAMNDPRHLPKPYTLRNTWNLVDEQGIPSGTILLFIRLSCLGKSIVTQFAVQDKSFLFKSSNSPNEFQCSRVPADENDTAKRDPIKIICEPEAYEEPEADPSPKPRSAIGLASVCQELSRRDGGPLEIVPPIKLSTHRSVEEECPKKCDVSGASSSNRECVMRTTTNSPCGSVICRGGLCTGRTIDASLVFRQGGTTTRSLPTGSYTSGHRANYRYRPRIRGGGRWPEDTSDFRADNCVNSKYRDAPIDRVPIQSVDTLISGACRSPLINESYSSKPGCGCVGKLGTGMMGTKPPGATRSGAACENNPCLGVDCLIRAFKETQDFVDSIGKVPGLAGLGLMDPTESPYFGRMRDEVPTSCVAQIGLSSAPLGLKTSGVQPLTLRSAHIARKCDTTAINTIFPAPTMGLGSPVHRDPHMHQTEIQSQISSRLKKRSDERGEKQKEPQEPSHQTATDGETGPCAEPRCKSRKKKAQEESSTDASAFNFQVATKKIAVGNKLPAPRVGRTRSRGRSKASTIPGPGGVRSSSQRSSYIRVSKRIMRLVNAMRDPRFCHGHKNCHDVRIRVPGNMGWLWNSNEVPGKLKTPIGWKPGAISKFVWDRLQEAKAMTAESGSASESRPTTPSKGKRGKSLRIKSFHSLGRSQWARSRMHEKDDDEVELPPTLHIHRKDGTYYVTMYPVKAENIHNPEMHEAVKPLQFKITKDKDGGSASSSSTASDMEIEFSPPAAVNRYKKKGPVKDGDTQVNQQEILDALKTPATKRQSKTKKVRTKK